jgi:hypothetical protein
MCVLCVFMQRTYILVGSMLCDYWWVSSQGDGEVRTHTTHTWTHYDKWPYSLNGRLCCYNSCTTPQTTTSVRFEHKLHFVHELYPSKTVLTARGFSGVMLAWHDDNPNLFQYILWVSTHQNQQHLTKRNNKHKILLQMLPWLLKKCWVCIFQILQMCTKQWDLYCNLTLNGSEQASKECKNCCNKALCLRDTAVLP